MNGIHENGIITYTAAASATKGTLVKFTGSTDAGGRPTVTPTTAATDQAIGAVIDDCQSGDDIAVAILGGCRGTMLVKAGGEIARGTQIAANGTASAAATDVIVGVALDPATASGDLIEIAHQVGQVK